MSFCYTLEEKYSPKSIEYFDQSVLNYVGLKSSPIESALHSNEGCENFILPLCLIGVLRSFEFTEDSHSVSLQYLKKIENIIQQGEYSEFEFQHYHAFKCWIEGDNVGAIRKYNNILMANALDVFALKVVSDLLFFCGEYQTLLEITNRTISYIEEGKLQNQISSLYGYILGIHSFALEENGFYDDAYEAASKAIELNKTDAWAIHAIAHIHEMRGEWEKGIQFLESITTWQDCHLISTHIWWHKALFHLELGMVEESWKILRDHIYKSHISGMNLIDATSLIWRFELLDFPVEKEEWTSLVEKWIQVIDKKSIPLNLIHASMTFSKGNDEEKYNLVLDFLKDNPVATNLCKGLNSFTKGDYIQTLNLIPKRTLIRQFGGSNAQRDVFCLTKIKAAKLFYEYLKESRKKSSANPNIQE